MITTKRRGPRSITQKTIEAGASSRFYAEYTELEETPLGAALIEQFFGGKSWRTAPLIEQEVCLKRIKGKINGGWKLDENGRISVPKISKEEADRIKNALFGPER